MIAFILVIFSIWKLIDIITSIVAPTIIPYLGNFSYADTMYRYGLPDFIRSWSNFDGIFYIRIALTGYSQYEQAFFPLYPLLIRLINGVIGNPIISGLLLSNLAFIVVLFLFNHYLKLLDHSMEQIKWFLGFLLVYPLSFYFGVIYTESLFLLFFLLFLCSVHKKNFILAFIFGYFAGLTRINGIFLIIPIIFYLFDAAKKKSFQVYASYLGVMIGPVLGLASYCYYLWKTTGDPLYFFTAQEYFGAHRSTKFVFFPQVIYRYIKIFLTADHNFQYFVAILECTIFIAVFSILVFDLTRLIRSKHWNIPRLGLNMFSFANLLLSTLTGTFTSIPRYSLLSISIFFVFSEIKNKALRIAIISIFAIWHIILLALFIQGYYIT